MQICLLYNQGAILLLAECDPPGVWVFRNSLAKGFETVYLLRFMAHLLGCFADSFFVSPSSSVTRF